MEPTQPSTPSPVGSLERKPAASTPWGVLIGLFLILAIIVSGAYYSFNKRFAPVPSVQGSSGIPS